MGNLTATSTATWVLGSFNRAVGALSTSQVAQVSSLGALAIPTALTVTVSPTLGTSNTLDAQGSFLAQSSTSVVEAPLWETQDYAVFSASNVLQANGIGDNLLGGTLLQTSAGIASDTQLDASAHLTAATQAQHTCSSIASVLGALQLQGHGALGSLGSLDHPVGITLSDSAGYDSRLSLGVAATSELGATASTNEDTSVGWSVSSQISGFPQYDTDTTHGMRVGLELTVTPAAAPSAQMDQVGQATLLSQADYQLDLYWIFYRLPFRLAVEPRPLEVAISAQVIHPVLAAVGSQYTTSVFGAVSVNFSATLQPATFTATLVRIPSPVGSTEERRLGVDR